MIKSFYLNNWERNPVPALKPPRIPAVAPPVNGAAIPNKALPIPRAVLKPLGCGGLAPPTEPTLSFPIDAFQVDQALRVNFSLASGNPEDLLGFFPGHLNGVDEFQNPAKRYQLDVVAYANLDITDLLNNSVVQFSSPVSIS